MGAVANKIVTPVSQRKETAPKESAALEFLPIEMAYGFMQLKPCACGGGCPRCKENKSNSQKTLQARFQINQPGDAYEQEADRVADEAMSSSADNIIGNRVVSPIQRLTSRTNKQVNTAPPSVDRTLSESGHSLEPALQQDMEHRLGHDFSRVKLHTSTFAEKSAKDIGALAYTIGNNIVFASGQFSPASQKGKRLLAHELAHVVQQSGNETSGIQRYVDINVLTTQVTVEKAQAMTDAELEREIQRLLRHINSLGESSTESAATLENLQVLEEALLTRRPPVVYGRPRTTTSVSPASALQSDPAPAAEAGHMTPDELVAEITRIRDEMTLAGAEDSVDNVANRELLTIFERELQSRDAAMLAYADALNDSRARAALGVGDAFFTGFLTSALHQMPEGEIHDFFDHDIRDHPFEFLSGCDEGLGRGFVDGVNNITDTAISIVELLERALITAIEHSDTISQLADDGVEEIGYQILGERLYTHFSADTSYLERRRGYEHSAELIQSELEDFAQELARDPTIVMQWSGNLGVTLGESFGRSVTEDFLRATPREQGVVVGRFLGQIFFEIVLQMALAVSTEGAGNAIRAGASALRGIEISAELAMMLREMVEASAAVRRLLRIIETGEEVADVTIDAARIAERTPDLPSTGTSGVLESVVEETRVRSLPNDESSELSAGAHATERSALREPSIDTEVPHADGAATFESVDTVGVPTPEVAHPITVEVLRDMGIPSEAVQTLDAAHFSSVELISGQQSLYILRDAEGTILKIGRTSEGAARGRFAIYRRAGAARIEVYPLEGEVTESMANTFETTLRERLVAEGNELPWDNTRGRLGRSGFGTPGEGVRTSPVSRERIIELLTLHRGNRRAVARVLAEELGRDSVHPRTVDMWARSFGIRTTDYR